MHQCIKRGYISVSFRVFIQSHAKKVGLLAAPRREPEAAEAILAFLVPRALPVAGTAVGLVRQQVPADTIAASVTGGTGIAASAAILLIQTESDTLSIAALGPAIAGIAAPAAIEIILVQVEIAALSVATLIPTKAGIAAPAAIVLIVLDTDTSSVTARLPPHAYNTGTTAIVRISSFNTLAVLAAFPSRS